MKSHAKRSAVAALILLAFVAVVAIAVSQPAKASNGGMALTLAQSTPAAAGAWAGSYDFSVICPATALGIAIAPPVATTPASTMAISCWVDGTTPVFFGGATTVTTSLGVPVCEDAACANGASAPAVWRAPMAKRSAFACIVASGTVTIRCNAVTPS